MAECRENQGACLQEHYNRIDFDEDKEQALEQASEQFAKEAFASFGGLVPGTEVLCTVLKKATERWRVLVAIDSVLERELAA